MFIICSCSDTMTIFCFYVQFVYICYIQITISKNTISVIDRGKFNRTYITDIHISSYFKCMTISRSNIYSFKVIDNRITNTINAIVSSCASIFCIIYSQSISTCTACFCTIRTLDILNIYIAPSINASYCAIAVQIPSTIIENNII